MKDKKLSSSPYPITPSPPKNPLPHTPHPTPHTPFSNQICQQPDRWGLRSELLIFPNDSWLVWITIG
ncbi:hypothetical protein K9N68_28420 [Kovacikia minuta CCNUW1]|uniref:hypothetical protein n=1 Tax=Kovacikia minuta TaxID=2931930 RepID=UPI001CC92B36|nr:hypothetical protein [Kovacikia minuta]UBF25470.1 hypothetical protein K9N68_28420 [Kovacikia minuta CCNUW1]